MIDSLIRRRQQNENCRELKTSGHLIDFTSNDYLGLARSSEFIHAFNLELEKTELGLLNGLGATGSRLLTGNSEYVQDLENSIAQFHGYESGLIFNCGYMANVGLISSIGGPDDLILFDIQVHASTHDGIRLSRSQSLPFRHQDLNHLEQRLKNFQNKGRKWICIDSIYSTDGSVASLKDISSLACRYDANIIVDEAHAVGIWGPQGRGLVSENQLESHVFAQIITFGKALGTFGAIVLGSQKLKQFLINFARSFIYTTALPFHVVAAIKSSYQLFPNLEKERMQLHRLINIYNQMATFSSKTQIQSIKIPGNFAVKQMSERLAHAGFDVRPLMSPTVKRGNEILRICLHTYNTTGQLISFFQFIQSMLQIK